jgi:hypothetical protein
MSADKASNELEEIHVGGDGVAEGFSIAAPGLWRREIGRCDASPRRLARFTPDGSAELVVEMLELPMTVTLEDAMSAVANARGWSIEHGRAAEVRFRPAYLADARSAGRRVRAVVLASRSGLVLVRAEADEAAWKSHEWFFDNMLGTFKLDHPGQPPPEPKPATPKHKPPRTPKSSTKPPKRPKNYGPPQWWVEAEALARAGDMESAERKILTSIDHLGAYASVANLWEEEMLRRLDRGDRDGAIVAYRKSADAMWNYAAGATSGGEGAALSRERDQHLAHLKALLGFEPEQA